MAKTPSKEQVKEAREARNNEEVQEKAERNAPADEARKALAQSRTTDLKSDREEQLKASEEASAAETKALKKEKLTLHDGKPGSGAGLRPGDWHAPASNPGAAARVPNQPLQPESMQSHGKGILYDKDLANPPYDTGDPLKTDASPSGSRHLDDGGIDKDAEVDKAERASARFKQTDPDNPTTGVLGKGDATASPHPIGTRNRRKDAAGGSNSGSTPA